MSCINREPHRLKGEKTLTMPRHIIFFDTETMGEEDTQGRLVQHLKLGWACYWRRAYCRHLERIEWVCFEEAVDFWAFVYKHLEHKQKLWVIARNIVFDFTVCQGWKYLRQAGFKVKFFHNEGITTVVSVRSKHGSIVFVDSMNWFRESIEETGKRIGLPKKKIDFETCRDFELSAYCFRDVEIELKNFKGFISFLESNNISRLCFTIGSCAMAAYLFRFYDNNIYIHNNEQAINLERASYRGGRVECFYIGELSHENYYVLDVNSLYPYVMRSEAYPVKYHKIIGEQTVGAFKRLLYDYAVVALVYLNTNEPVYAVRHERTIFPVGRFWACLTTPELKYAVKHKHLIMVKAAVLYEQARIFTRYVDNFYALRQRLKKDGDTAYEGIVKLLLNSLYGKFGQKAATWEKIGDCPTEPDRCETVFKSEGGRTTQIRYLLGEIFELTGYKECFDSFPAIASHVAAYSRLHLWKLMQIAGSGNYYYCDTDSLIVNSRGFSNLKNYLHDTRLGYLKVQERMNVLSIKGLKDYKTEEKIVIKGISKNALSVSEGVYRQQQWPSFKGTLRSGKADTYSIETTTKILQRKYTKGDIDSSGWVTPFMLAEFKEPDAFLFPDIATGNQ